MRFSVIIPSYNQAQFIEATLQSLVALKKTAIENGHEIEIILCDNESDANVQTIIKRYQELMDVLKIEKDKGQYDAINKGLHYVTGQYWTWLNSDDLIDCNGFLEIVNYLKNHQPDYIYGNIETIDAQGNPLGKGSSGYITLKSLTSNDASISQPGSFFKTTFTHKIGILKPYQFAFDYEYVLRILKNNGSVAMVNCVVAQFRYYQQSKSGSQDARFLIEQLEIAKLYGCTFFSKLSLMLRLRILKRQLFKNS